MKKVSLVAICLMLCVAFSACTGNSGFSLDLSQIKNSDSSFCYSGLDWDSTAKETQEVLKIDFGEAITSTIDQGDLPSFVSSVYYPKAVVALMNRTGTSTFEYRDDVLTSMLFSFTGDPTTMKTFEADILKELIQVYSDVYEVKERESEDKTTRTEYIWTLPYGERTSYMQLISMGKANSYSVSIGVLCPNKKS